MDTKDAPQLLEHIYKSLTFTPSDVKQINKHKLLQLKYNYRWVPMSARFVLLGQSPKAKGVFQIFQLNRGELELVTEVNLISQLSHQYTKEYGIKCSTFKASSITQRDLACGDYKGYLDIYDLETGKSKYHVKAHEGIMNQIDGIGGKGPQYGAPQIATAGRDGTLVQKQLNNSDQDVSEYGTHEQINLFSVQSHLMLKKSSQIVGQQPIITNRFGNCYNSEERCLCAGYDNGDVKMFDLRTNCLRWDTNVKNGVCGLQFDRQDINMNKLVVTSLQSKFWVYDLKTHNPQVGFTGLSQLAHKATIWGVRHLPQNRDLFATLGGNGGLNLYKYHYPAQRVIKDANNIDKGVVGSVQLLNSKVIAQQPIVSLDFNTDKQGLAVLCSLDQACRVALITKLNLY